MRPTDIEVDIPFVSFLALNEAIEFQRIDNAFVLGTWNFVIELNFL
jgi:hypothetical protein